MEARSLLLLKIWALVNINIEYENSCHLVGVSDNVDTTESYTHKVMDVDVAGSVGVSGAVGAASVNGTQVASASRSSAGGSIGTFFHTKEVTDSSSMQYDYKEEQNNCHLIIYGSALSIKYTNAIIPKCDNCR